MNPFLRNKWKADNVRYQNLPSGSADSEKGGIFIVRKKIPNALPAVVEHLKMKIHPIIRSQIFQIRANFFRMKRQSKFDRFQIMH